MDNELPTIHQADRVHVANAMLRGGGFMAALSRVLIRADLRNRRKILAAWEDDITQEWERWGRTDAQVYEGRY